MFRILVFIFLSGCTIYSSSNRECKDPETGEWIDCLDHKMHKHQEQTQDLFRKMNQDAEVMMR